MEIVIVDTEFTAWEGSKERHWSGPNEYIEIIQIAAIKFDILNEKIIGEPFHQFVKPIKNPILSNYIKNLTGISQNLIDTEGTIFKEAIENFISFSTNHCIACWGHDHIVFNENCQINKLNDKYFQKNYFNLMKYLNDQFKNKFYTNSGNLLNILNINKKPDENEHNALFDVYAIAFTLEYLLKNKHLNKIHFIHKIKEHLQYQY